MIYKEIKPSPILADFVKLIWIMEYNFSGELPPPERIMTDGIVELVFHFGEPFNTYYYDNTKEKQPNSFFIAQLNKHILIQPEGKAGIISVRFYPWGAYHFFDIPVKAFGDKTTNIEHIWGKEAFEIEEEICSAQNNKERVKLVENFLVKKLIENHKVDFMPDKILRYIQKTKGQLPLKTLLSNTGITERTLERKFLSSVGVTPKQFSRITRFLNTCSFLEKHKAKSLTQITYECGYYDQAHFIREFKEFAGITPKEYFKETKIAFYDL